MSTAIHVENEIPEASLENITELLSNIIDSGNSEVVKLFAIATIGKVGVMNLTVKDCTITMDYPNED